MEYEHGRSRGAGAKDEGVKGARILIVEARFYDDIADALLAGATRALEQAGASYERITRAGLAGNPAGDRDGARCRRRSGSKPYDGAVALGCVIRGETIHFEIVSEQSARALIDLSVARHIPLGNGILTVENEAQAWARARIDRSRQGRRRRARRARAWCASSAVSTARR